MEDGNEMMMKKKIYSSYPALVDLMQIREDPRTTPAMKDQIQILEQGLQFLVIYWNLLTLFNKGVKLDGIYLNFDAMIRIKKTLKRIGIQEIGIWAMRIERFSDWDTLCSELSEEIQSYKKLIREDLSIFCNGLYNFKWFSIDSLLEFISRTDRAMINVLGLKGDQMIPDEKMKFESIKVKLCVFQIVFNYMKESHTEFLDLYCALNAWVCNAAYLCLFYWVYNDDDDDHNIAHERNVMLSKLYRNFDSPHPKVTEYCVKYLKSDKILIKERCNKKDNEAIFPDVTRISLSYLLGTKALANKHQETCEVNFRFFESLLWSMRGYLPNDSIEMLLDALLFLTAFITDPLAEDEEEVGLALSKSKEALKEVGNLIISLGSGEKDEAGIVEATNFLIHDFFEIIITIKAEVRKSYPLLFLDPSFNFPRINILNLLDSSIEKIKKFPFYFPKHPIWTLEKELVVLRDLLKETNLKDHFILQLQNEHIGSKDLWTRISNVAYQVDRIITPNEDKCGLGIHIFFLLDVQEELKRICPKVKMTQVKYLQADSSCSLRSEKNLINNIVPLNFDVQEMDEFVVGFDNKVNEIRDLLIHGSEKLEIISIFGRAGLGKTTLAKKIYNDSSVKAHFNTCSWCTISQSYDIKKLMLDILKDVTVVNDSFLIEMEVEDLADKLRKSLMGKRYLIVMDDMWDSGAWNELRLCFRDHDQKGCRILLTSRISKEGSNQYDLTKLSDQQSFELLERKLFHDKDICPRNFVESGKKIARDCNGLPLAIVLVAGLLKKEINNLDWWKQIEETLDSRIYEEGCSQILEFSYKHLSEPLKACFLYLGLFQEDKVIPVKKLINLWVSEGFIQVKKENQNPENVARKYLMDLIARSMLIVSSKSSRGGIKTCRVHDLLREFCLDKCREEHFFNINSQVDDDTTMDQHYRVSIQTTQHLNNFFVRKSSSSSSPLHSISICSTSNSSAFDISPSSFCRAVYLQVLDLEDVKWIIGDFPEELTMLIFLRYLAIRCSAKSIPATIEKLKRLETLRVMRDEVAEFDFPQEIFRIESLRHVHIGKVTNPRFINPSIHPMKNIESLSILYVTREKYKENFIDFIRRLKMIRKLKCRFYEQEKVINLDFLHRLVSLNLLHEGRPLLRRFGFLLPTCIKKLTLSNFSLGWSEISRISRLQNLEVLKILVNAFNGSFWNMGLEEKFKKLKFLKLQSLNVQKWSGTEENFPCLEQIVIEHCYKLKEIPIEFVEIPSLKKIQIRRCRSSLVKSAQEIEDQQIECGNLNFKVEAVQILSNKRVFIDYNISLRVNLHTST